MAKIIKMEDNNVLIGTDDGDINIEEKETSNFQNNENSNKPIIFYGISESMKRDFDKFVAKTGEPKLIVEKDENLDKFPKKLFDKYDVVSLDEALERYPNATIWVTYGRAKNAANRILKKVEPERIKFFKAKLEYRLGCNYLGHFIDYRVDNFSPCCVSSNSKVKTSGSISDRIAHWQSYVTQLIDDIKNNRPNKCDDCRKLKLGFWPKKVKLDYICFATNHPGDVCNLRCTYCFVKNRFEELKNIKDGYTTYETLKQLSQMPEYDNPHMCIELSNGEFCANKHCDEIFEILLRNQWKIRFVSNMTIYREKFAEFLKTGRTVNVLTSLDSGTRETYKAIKGVDCLDKVVENIKKYPLENVDFSLKYIFLDGVNDNETDVDGFYDIVKQVGCKTIVISSDCCKPFTGKMRELAKRLIIKAQQDNLRVIKSSYLASEDCKFVDELVDGTE